MRSEETPRLVGQGPSRWIRIVRGQSALVSVLSPAALNGARRRVDLKFIVFTGNGARTTSSLQIIDTDTGKVTVAVSMGEGERY
jgi:hypothetical protein